MDTRVLKDQSPRWLKDVANVTTRAFGMATASARPLPDFLVVGAKRGGTTTLWNAMLGHPQVLGMFPEVRGLKSNEWFFDRRRSQRWYRSHFHTRRHRAARERQVGRTVVGEASPYYMYGPHIPGHLRQVVPHAKLVVLLRDPVERAFSHYQERRKEGVEWLGFEDALAAEQDRLAEDADLRRDDPTHYSRAHDFFSYRDRGVYLPQVQRLQLHFPEEQLLVRISEDLYRDPTRVLDDVASFLGIDPFPAQPVEHHNRIPRAPMPDHVRAELASFYAPWNQRLAEHLGVELPW